MSRFGRTLRDDEVQAAAELIKQGVPPAEVTRILEAMQRAEDGATVMSHASTSVAGTGAWGEKTSEGHSGAALPGPSRSQTQPPQNHDPSLPPPYEARD